ncbi:Mbov_0398 family ICE element protein [Metamycoplasma auris]|uniref:ICEF Integrative Conjugal Element-II n=1 Tax=Metamycoplasma auris TaxID=51363 RepID=A0A2W7FSM1_9BACT|nr:hypothetical protein [Metamycoplasma auris]PZV97301.1 hypothetical protein BCF89_1401 [Metamycoplasma auris]
MAKKFEPLRVTFRLYEKDDIARFEKFKRTNEIENKSTSEAIGSVFREYLYNKEKEIVFRDALDDIYYAMRKVLYSSLAPFQSNLTREILKNRAELMLINKKLDVLLNSSANLDKKILANLNTDLLNEASYFEKMRSILDIKHDETMTKINEKIKQVKDSEKQFEYYRMRNGELDARIIKENIEGVESLIKDKKEIKNE